MWRVSFFIHVMSGIDLPVVHVVAGERFVISRKKVRFLTKDTYQTYFRQTANHLICHVLLILPKTKIYYS